MNHDTVFWLGNVTSYAEAQSAIEKGEALAFEARSGFSSDSGDDEQFSGYDYMTQLTGNTAIVAVKGNLVANEKWYNRYVGIVSYPEIQNAISAAVNHPEVKDVLLDIGSNGGDAHGPAGLAKFIATVDKTYKPIYAYTGSNMASAAYWLGAGVRKIYATDMATIGSIGVIAIHKEMTKMLDMDGIKATVLREGKFKALGTPYEKLSPEAKAHIQSKMHDMYGFFMSDVAKLRGLSLAHVKAKAAEGQTFWGPEAKSVGLVDKIMTLEEVVNQLATAHNSKQHELHPVNNAGTRTMADANNRIVITTEAREAMALGMTEDEALAKFGAEETESEEVAASADAEQEAAASEGSEEATEAEAAASEGAATEEPKTPVPAAEGSQDAGSSAAVTALTAQLAEANEKLVDARVELKETQNELGKFTASHEGLKAIAISTINKMQIALGGSAQDLTHMGAATLLAQHASTEKTFHERYPVGGKATVSKEKATDQPTAKPDAARRNATSFT